METLDTTKIDYCRQLGIVDETALRNLNIRLEFKRLKGEGKGAVEAINILMQEHNLSWSRVNGIVYNKEA